MFLRAARRSFQLRPRAGLTWRSPCLCQPTCAPLSWIGTRNFSDTLSVSGFGFPKSSSNFVSFEEACEYTRILGLRSTRDWREWCQHGSRPPWIPTAPHVVYKASGWRGYENFLGYEKKFPKYFDVDAPFGNQRRADVLQRESTRDNGYHFFLDFISHGDASSPLEFQKTSQRSAVQLLFRPTAHRATSDDRGSWSALYIRCRQQLAPGGGFALRRPSCGRIDCGMVLIAVSERKILFIPRSDLVSLITRIWHRSDSTFHLCRDLVQRYTVHQPVDLRALLANEFSTNTQYAMSELEGRFAMRSPDLIHLKLISQLKNKLYAHFTGYSLTFPISTVTRGYNGLLGGHRLLQRVAHPLTQEGVMRVKVALEHRNIGRVAVPLCIDDELDFAIVMCRDLAKLRDGELFLHGAFIFPKPVLAEWGVLASSLSRGKRSFCLYPPDMQFLRKPSRERQTEQLQYYINLSWNDGDPRLLPEIEKARRLLKLT